MMAETGLCQRKKALIVFGIIYLFLPIDLIPPILFPIAWVDDLIIWLCILWYLRNELDKYWMGGKTKDYSRKYGGRTFVDDCGIRGKERVEGRGRKRKEERRQMAGDTVGSVIITQEQINARAAEIAREIENDFRGEEIVLVGILRGAVMWIGRYHEEL